MDVLDVYLIVNVANDATFFPVLQRRKCERQLADESKHYGTILTVQTLEYCRCDKNGTHNPMRTNERNELYSNERE